MPDKALMLRTCDKNMQSYGGFQWPESGRVTAPDWSDRAECGGGLHGLPWGEGNGGLLNWSEDAKWLVCEVDPSLEVPISGKSKWPWADVVFVGDREGATKYLRENGGIGLAIVGSTISVGDGSTVSGGYHSIVRGGYRSTVSGGEGSTISVGDGSTVSGGEGSGLILKHWNGKRYRYSLAEVGENGIKANTPYRLDDEGKFIEVEQEDQE